MRHLPVPVFVRAQPRPPAQGALGNSSRHGRRPGQPGAEGGLDQWEIVQDSTIFSFDSIEDLKQKLQPSTHVQLSPEDVMVWQKLMVAIMTVPWPISTEYSEDSRYNTLLQVSAVGFVVVASNTAPNAVHCLVFCMLRMIGHHGQAPSDKTHRKVTSALSNAWQGHQSATTTISVPVQISIGQEETDDIISRDINRTFPEHPQFAFEQGQNALFRVLKAYSLHDLEARLYSRPAGLHDPYACDILSLSPM